MSEQQVSLYRRENEARFSSEHHANTQVCYLCGKEIEQDDDTRGWFPADLMYKPTFRSDWLDAFETREGWVCSSSCWNDNCALNEDESVPSRPFLVRRSA